MKKRSLFIVILLLVVPLLGFSTNAATDQELAESYAPIFYFEMEEIFYPVNSSYHLQNSYLKIFGDDNISFDFEFYSELIELGNISESMDILNEYAYLDNQKGTVDDYDGIINDYQEKLTELGYTVYYRVYTNGDTKVLQYWMFYAFNNGELNQHEGDWELVQVVLESETPSFAMYSQHNSGRKAEWSDVERDGDNFKVYVARGSHANYFRSYSGKFGIANDIVGENGKILEPVDYELVMLDSQIWLDFPGRWGEFNNLEDVALGRAGPFGPVFRENGNMWDDPISWGNSLQQADENLFTAQWFTYNFEEIYILLTLLSILILGIGIYLRHRKYGLGPRIFSILYIDGLNLKSIGNILCIVGIIIIVFALFQPWYHISYTISGDTSYVSFATNEPMELLVIDGVNGIQFYMPSASGAIPLYNISIPFALIIAVGLILFILTTIGRYRSWKLGRKYLFRGIKVMLPVILIITAIVLIGMLLTEMMPPTGDTSVDNSIVDILTGISASPIAGQNTIVMQQSDVNIGVDVDWGLGDGCKYFILGGIILIISGILEIASHAEFFEPKIPYKSRKRRKEELKKTMEPPSEYTNDETKSNSSEEKIK